MLRGISMPKLTEDAICKAIAAGPAPGKSYTMLLDPEMTGLGFKIITSPLAHRPPIPLLAVEFARVFGAFILGSLFY